MRRTIELIVNRVLRSRYGLAALLTLVVLGVVGGAQLFAGRADPPSGVAGARPGPLTTVNPTAGADGLSATRPAASPQTVAGSTPPIKVARAFALAWVHHDGVTAAQWLAGLTPHATADLMGQLAETDPGSVPAERLAGEPTLIPRGQTFVEVAVPVDPGRLLLRVVTLDGRWQVDGVDWEPS